MQWSSSIRFMVLATVLGFLASAVSVESVKLSMNYRTTSPSLYRSLESPKSIDDPLTWISENVMQPLGRKGPDWIAQVPGMEWVKVNGPKYIWWLPFWHLVKGFVRRLEEHHRRIKIEWNIFWDELMQDLEQRYDELPSDSKELVQQQMNKNDALQEWAADNDGHVSLKHMMTIESYIREEEKKLRQHRTMTDDDVADSEVAKLRLGLNDPVMPAR